MDFNKILHGGIVVKQIWISILSMIEQKMTSQWRHKYFKLLKNQIYKKS